MPGLKIISTKLLLNEKNIKIAEELDQKIEYLKKNTSQEIEKTFGIKPNLEDPRLSESAKQI